MTIAAQAGGVNPVIVVPQQLRDGGAPDFFYSLFFKEDTFPDAVLHAEPAAGDGDVNVRMLVELSPVSVQGAEDTDLNALFAGPP